MRICTASPAAIPLPLTARQRQDTRRLQWLPEQECEEATDLAEEGCSLGQLLAEGAAFYEQDFGDSWLHRLTLVPRRPADYATMPAQFVDGARRGSI